MIYHNYSPYYYSSLNYYPNRVTSKTYSDNPSKPNEFSNHHNPILTSNSYRNHYSMKNSNVQNNNYNIKNNSVQNNNDNIKSMQSHQKNSSCEEDCDNSKEDNILFEIFGIKLYFDDILLICLIFFLYTEGVEDQYLFIALILLLLS